MFPSSSSLLFVLAPAMADPATSLAHPHSGMEAAAADLLAPRSPSRCPSAARTKAPRWRQAQINSSSHVSRRRAATAAGFEGAEGVGAVVSFKSKAAVAAQGGAVAGVGSKGGGVPVEAEEKLGGDPIRVTMNESKQRLLDPEERQRR